jgi:cellulase
LFIHSPISVFTKIREQNMRQSFVLTAWWAGLAAAHGHLKEYIIDGTTYPAFDPAFDHEPKYNIKRIEYGFPKAKGGVGPVENVASPDINCRFRPLKEPGIESVARAGSNITFQWLDWFQSHKGPVITVRNNISISARL